MPTAHFLLNGLSIILIDLLLAGDNALVIAMAVRALPPPERRLASILGAAFAVVLRVALTAMTTLILALPFLKLGGGILVLWIAVKVVVDATDPPDAAPAPRRLLRAIWFITMADITMSIDNILAIAGASNGHVALIVFGLCLSIPFVVFSSNLLARLMDRFPVLIYLGAGILAKVGGDMIFQDPFVTNSVHPSTVVRCLIDCALIAAVLIGGNRISASRLAVSTSPLEPE